MSGGREAEAHCGGRGGTGQSRSGWAGSSGSRPTPSSPSLAPGPPEGAVRRSEVGGSRPQAGARSVDLGAVPWDRQAPCQGRLGEGSFVLFVGCWP